MADGDANLLLLGANAWLFVVAGVVVESPDGADGVPEQVDEALCWNHGLCVCKFSTDARHSLTGVGPRRSGPLWGARRPVPVGVARRLACLLGPSPSFPEHRERELRPTLRRRRRPLNRGEPAGLGLSIRLIQCGSVWMPRSTGRLWWSSMEGRSRSDLRRGPRLSIRHLSSWSGPRQHTL